MGTVQNELNLSMLEGEKLYNELVTNYVHLSEEELNLYFLKLEGRFLYEAGKNIHKLSADVKKKGFKKLEGKYIIEAMKHWKGISKEDKRESLSRLADDGRLYSQAVKILEH